jgi:hypothetical protein
MEPSQEANGLRPSRIGGALEHVNRVRLFGIISAQVPDWQSKYRLAVAAIYSCRAFSEILLEAADKQEFTALDGQTPRTRASVEADLAARIPFYSLIERIRIHDFHRFGLTPPDPNGEYSGVGMLGPIRLTVQRGSAGIWLGENGLEQITEGASSVKLMRPLVINNGHFFDDESQRFVDLAEVLNAFLEKAPSIAESYSGLLR